MCRYHQLWGCCLGAYGLGILSGAWLGGSFLCTCLGFGLVACGIVVLKK